MGVFKKNKALIIIFAAFVYFTTAYNSHGFYHADEQYQIIEFAGLKLGTHSVSDLAWEFKAQIRPTLQPVICFTFLKIFEIFNINNPYNQACLLRILSALMALIAISFFVKNTESLIKKKPLKTAYYLVSYLLWFIPVVSVRFSSETWSGILFLLSLSVFFSESKNTLKPFLIGLIFGFSFLFRFQIGFVVLGFILWIFVYKHASIKYLFKIITALTLVIFLGVLVDSWFYGELVFAPWKYFKLVLESGGDGFGASNWYYYFIKLLSYPSFFVGAPLVLSLILILIYKRDNFLLWCILPFIIIHSLIPHKEERFLFPIIYLFPLALMEGYIIFETICRKKSFLKLINVLLITIFIIVNAIGIIAMGQKSAGIGRMEITKHIHDNYGDENINLIYCSWANPYDPWHGLPIKFYLEESIITQKINNLCELNDSLFQDDAVNLIVVRKIDKQNIECSKILNSDIINFEIQSIPRWVELINQRYKGFENHEILELHKLKRLD